jgi:molybdopterin molybdotransferase
MDGYAARRADLPGPLRLAGRSVAGARHDAPLAQGDCVRIFTGAPVPVGADVVVPQERAKETADGILLDAEQESFIRPAGGDFKAGAALLPAGARINPWRLALVAASGLATIAVARRPRVLVLSSGDELVTQGGVAGPDQIFDSAGPAVLARAITLGAIPVGTRHLPDDRDAVTAALAQAQVDLIVAIGGASVGDADHFRPAARALGASLIVEGVKVRPGRPTWFARMPDGRRALGLPGNPASALVCAELFLRPLLAALQGADPSLPLVQARLAAPLPANGPREHWMRAQLTFADGCICVTPDADQDSGWTGVFARADALVRRPINAPSAREGDCVDVLMLHGLAPA